MSFDQVCVGTRTRHATSTVTLRRPGEPSRILLQPFRSPNTPVFTRTVLDSGSAEVYSWCSCRASERSFRLVRYLDSGTTGVESTLGHWLEGQLVQDLCAIRIQTGYFSFSSVAQFANTLSTLAERGTVRMVLGANQGQLTSSEVRTLWGAVRFGHSDDSSLIVVSFRNALFHPKVYHVVRADGSSSAIVGSANLTPGGLGRNVESLIALDSLEDQQEVLDSIALAIDSWCSPQEGVFRIESLDDIARLEDEGILPPVSPPSPPTAAEPRRAPGSAGGPRYLQGTRRALWRPARTAPTPTPATPVPAGTTTASAAIVAHWSKRLSASDAQRVRQGTNQTGKLRLAQAGNPIDHRTFFRRGLFGSCTWSTETRNGNPVELTDIPFRVSIDGRDFGTQVLRVDHAEHRIAGQNNVPSILAWGRVLSQELARTDYTGATVTIERDSAGVFFLRITR